MAKKTEKPAATTSIEVRYDLQDLPSAQHKAGLAGLLLQIENMTERREKGQLPADCEIPEIIGPLEASTVLIRFTERSVQYLFDDLYAAETVEVRSKTKWQGAAEKRQEPNPTAGPGEPKRWFIYDTVQPSGHFLRNFTEGEKESWHKLWRDMIYAVPRNKPTTRQAFKSCADKKPTKEGAEAWKALLAREKATARKTLATTELAGSLMLAVQAFTAEAVAFEDRVETQLLLHFWILTARVFVPQRVDADGKNEFVGYTLAIPEVADLCKFSRRYKESLEKLDVRKNGYRPAGAVIALPEQGPLEFLYNLDRLATEKTLKAELADYVAGIEFFHMVVAGNNVKLKAHGRIPVEGQLIERYGAIRRDFHNPTLLTGLILAVLRDRPWFAELDVPIHEQEWSFFVHSNQERRRTPAAMTGFAWEVDGMFRSLFPAIPHSRTAEELAMSQSSASAEAVDAIIYDLVKVYVRERSCLRTGVKPDDKEWMSKTADERRDVCSKLFLEFRSRHGDEFVAYFTDTIASVAQWLDEGRFLIVARALMRPHSLDDGPDRERTRDDVKTLTMLALAAHSRSVKAKDSATSASSMPTTTNATEDIG